MGGIIQTVTLFFPRPVVDTEYLRMQIWHLCDLGSHGAGNQGYLRLTTSKVFGGEEWVGITDR